MTALPRPTDLLPTLRVGPVSIRWRPRAVLVSSLLLLALILMCAVHLAWGSTSLDPVTVLRTLVGDAPDERTALIVQEFRLPRTVAAITSGMTLALAGALMQTVSRNPLASPDVLGVTSGASLGAVSVLVLAGGGAGGLSGVAALIGMPAAAFAGGLIAGGAVFVLAYRGTVSGHRVILVGLGITWLASSLTTWLLTLGDVTNAAQALTWMTGSLNAEEWGLVAPLSVAALTLCAGATMLARPLALAAFDETTATGLGARIGATRTVALLAAVLLSSVATVLAGPIGFVALAAPQIARLLTRGSTPPLFASALTGALMVVLADLLTARILPVPLPAGVGTALIGAPYLVWLLITMQRRSS